MIATTDALCEMEGVPLRHRNRLARKHFPVTAARFREARLSCFLTVEGCAELLRISVRTVQNWEAGTVRPPYAAYKLMRVLRGGKVLGPEWRGFTIRADRLNTPEGHTFHAGDLAWWSLLVRQARQWQKEAKARAEAARGRDVPLYGLVCFSTSEKGTPSKGHSEAENKAIPASLKTRLQGSCEGASGVGRGGAARRECERTAAGARRTRNRSASTSRRAPGRQARPGVPA